MLFRKPVKGDDIQKVGADQYASVGRVQSDWSDTQYDLDKARYRFVTITEVEGPPPPRVSYVNVYPPHASVKGGPALSVGSTYDTLEEANEKALSRRVACIRLVEGQYDE